MLFTIHKAKRGATLNHHLNLYTVFANDYHHWSERLPGPSMKTNENVAIRGLKLGVRGGSFDWYICIYASYTIITLHASISVSTSTKSDINKKKCSTHSHTPHTHTQNGTFNAHHAV